MIPTDQPSRLGHEEEPDGAHRYVAESLRSRNRRSSSNRRVERATTLAEAAAVAASALGVITAGYLWIILTDSRTQASRHEPAGQLASV